MVSERQVRFMLIKPIMTGLAMLVIHVCGMFVRFRPAR